MKCGFDSRRPLHPSPAPCHPKSGLVYHLGVGIAIGSVVALVYRVTSLFLWASIGIITARTLTLDDRGVYASAVIVIGVISGIASFSSAASYLVANQHREPAEVGTHGALLALVVGAAVALGALAISPFVPADLHLVVILCGFSVLPAVVRNTLSGVLLGSHQFSRYNVATSAAAAIGLVTIAVWVGILRHRSAESALQAWTAAQYLSLLPVLFWGRHWWSWPWKHGFNRAVTRRMLSYGAVTGAASVIAFFNYRVDVLMVIGLDSREGAGIYSSSVAVAEGLWLFSSAIALASYARVGSTSREEAAHLTALAVRHTIIVVVSGAVVAAVVAPPLLGIVFGDVYRAGATPLRILCIGTAAYAPASLIGNYFTVQLGRPAIALWLAGLSCLVSVSVGFALIPAIGYTGAAWATTLSYTLSAAIATVVFLRITGIPASELWRIRQDDVLSYFRLVRQVIRRRRLIPALGTRN